ncbi:twin-arginine translocation signal domain-containing protein [Natrarchaeobaculum aegyptiacum]|uniref:Uncharacterized protein n=1 Tax=Natrarchaeobaculum aegyptiacum TaxID=745377 RepID=A0A2Z2HND4_9EURY|nr:twin-arginine translocation signal domain-containing protein [Natrarchaeobaculum aegyptiacum]ARS88436.1 hypothetical protein B1756_00830 [Natrarchaeobaculum aegyptiacum]
MKRIQNRRRFLQLATAGAAASVAGCSDLQPSTDDGSEPETPQEQGDGDEIDPDDVSDTALTALVQPDPDELAEIEAEIVEQVEAGELDQMQAQQEMQRRQMEIIDDLADSFQSTAADADAYHVEASMPDQGAFLVDGDAEALVAQLNDGAVSALLPSQEYVEAQEAMAAQPDPDEMDEEALEEELQEQVEEQG